ncbi:MAG: periplasmic heavy metal sensor [Desulfobaccales bacterium]
MKAFGKRSLLLALTLVLAVGVAAVVWAEAPQGMPQKPGSMMMQHCNKWHHGHMNLTPDQAAKLFDVKEKFRTDTAALRKQVFVGKAELAALWKAETPDGNAIVAKIKALAPLKEQLVEKKVLMRLEVRQIVPKTPMKTGMGEGGDMGSMAMGPGSPMTAEE